MSNASHITFDRYSLFVDGQRVVIRSGAMHYFRLPHPQLWENRLQQLKAAGYNTVDLYFSWDFHSQAPGQYDFTGCRDIKQLLELTQSLGLHLIARPGPYINAETARGGLPAWLFQQPNVVIRNRLHGKHHNSPVYMGFVKEWFDQVLPFIADCPNLLMVQIENEYGTEDLESDYFKQLTQWVRQQGITVPTMHNDFYASGLYEDCVDIYAIDNYCVTSFDTDWRKQDDTFAVIDSMEEMMRDEVCSNRPLMVAELQAGWFAQWHGPAYTAMDESLDRHHIGLITRSVLAQGCTLFNHYKAIGGTNWGYIGASDVCTSYDFCSPIAESGLPSSRYYEAKRINQLLKCFDWEATDWAESTEHPAVNHPAFYRLRQSTTHPDTQWLTLRNLSSTSITVPLNAAATSQATLYPLEAVCLPLHYPLACGWVLTESTVEPLGQGPACLILPGDRPLNIALATQNPPPVPTHVEHIVSVTAEPNGIRLQHTQGIPPDAIISIPLGSYWVHILGANWLDRLWQVGTETHPEWWLGPTVALYGTTEPVFYGQANTLLWHINAIGERHAVTPNASVGHRPLPTLHWQCHMMDTPPLSSFKPLSQQQSDFASNDIHHGGAWYHVTLNQLPNEITLAATHLWSAFINGQCVGQGHHLVVPPHSFDINALEESFRVTNLASSNTGTFELMIYCESLGDHKGFYQDTLLPTGLLALRVDGKSVLESMRICPMELTPTAGESLSGQGPFLMASSTFEYTLSDTEMMPLALDIDCDVERITIFLNNMLIGRYWRTYGHQTRFYLPEGVLNTHGKNHLDLILTQGSPSLVCNVAFPQYYGRVELATYGQFAKL